MSKRQNKGISDLARLMSAAWDFPACPVIKNLLSSVGGAGWIPGLIRELGSYVPWDNLVTASQLRPNSAK